MLYMNKILIFDTSSGSLNLGDYIIKKCAEKQLHQLFLNDYIVYTATHTPVTHFYQAMLNKTDIVRYANEAKHKIICGTNILSNSMDAISLNWNINIFNCKPYINSVLMAVGCSKDFENLNLYTKFLYKKIFSTSYIHSTRDDKTAIVLSHLGYKAINTGCVTLWNLNKEHCLKIPKKKNSSVVFTLTDYAQDFEKDQFLIDVLNCEYDDVYFWIQGDEDLKYLKKFKNIDKIHIIPPNLISYENVLKLGVDYVGTRLHAGIYAMNYCCRSIIIAVDNRAREMNKTNKLNCIERDSIDDLPRIIASDIITDVHLNEDNINRWKSQFINSSKV